MPGFFFQVLPPGENPFLENSQIPPDFEANHGVDKVILRDTAKSFILIPLYQFFWLFKWEYLSLISKGNNLEYVGRKAENM